MKKIISIIIVLSFVITFFAACGGSSAPPASGTAEAPAPSASTESQETSSAPADNSGGQASISIFSSLTEARQDYEVYGENIKKTHPNISLDISVAQTEDYPQLLKTKVASGDAPDIFSLWPGLSYVTYYAKNGHLLDVSDSEWVQYILPGSLPTVSLDDKVYSLPLGMNVIGVVYNKEIFSEMNLGIPETWEDFLVLCETIKSNGIIPIAMPAKTDWPPQFLPIYTLPSNIVYSINPQFDNQLFDGLVTFSDSDYTRCFEMFMDLEARGYYNPTPLGVTLEQTEDMIANGEIAMCVQGDWAFPALLSKNSNLDLGMFPVPAPAGYTTTVPLGGAYCMSGSSKTQYPDEVKIVLDYMASQEAYDLSDSLKNGISPLSNIKTDPHPAVLEMLVHAEKASYPFTNLVWVPGIQEAFQKGYQELLAGIKDIPTMLKEVDEIAVRNIASFKME